MIRDLLARLQARMLARPAPVLAGGLVLGAIALALGSGVEFRSSRSELAPPDDPDQQRWNEVLRDYRGTEAVIACVEAAAGAAADPGRLRAFVDRLAVAFAAEPEVERVFHRLDVERLAAGAPWLVPEAEAAALETALEREVEFLAAVAASGNLTQLNLALARRLKAGRVAGAAAAAEPGSGQALAGIARMLAAEDEFLADPSRAVQRLVSRSLPQRLAAMAGGGDADGYTRTRDGRTLFLLVVPRKADDSLPALRHLLGSLRTAAARVAAESPGFRVGFAGTAAMTVEEMDAVRRDTWRTSAVAVLGVGLLTLFVFRWRFHAALVLSALALGVLWSFGAVRLELGHLNMITSAFISTLVGVGVAYGIHPVSEYELAGAHTGDVRQAVREAYRRTGAAVCTAGMTTSVAFFSILLMRFRGFAELGIVAGVGVLLCLLSAMVWLPALLVVYGTWRRQRDRSPREERGGIGRWWVERGAGRVCRFPRSTVALAAAATVIAGWGALGLRFDTNLLDLLPADAESLRYQKRMMFDSDLSPVFNIVVADGLDELKAMRRRAQSEPSIARFESVLRFLPEDPDAAARRVERWNRALDPLLQPAAVVPLERESLVASLWALEDQLGLAAEAAFGAGMADLAGPLEQARQAAEDGAVLARGAGEKQILAWNRAQERVAVWAGEQVQWLRRALAAPPPSVERLPSEIRERFFTSGGRPVALLYPSGSVFEPAELERYVDASLRVSESAIGFPLMFRKMSRRITRGFYRASIAGALLVSLILIVDLRSLGTGLLALLPLALGLVWTAGIMRVLGIDLDFANLVAFPLIIGVGIDNGVHIVHRVRLEGREGIDVVLRHTGRAILIASLTTMIGFGSLSLASHRGLAGLGVVLFVGVASCLISSTVVLPNLLVALGRVRRSGPVPDSAATMG